jgi:hypothetical protein
VSVKVTCTPRTFSIEIDEEGAKQLRALIGNIGYSSSPLNELYRELSDHVDAEFDDYFRVDATGIEMWPA